MGLAKSWEELEEIEFIKGGITFGNSQILYRDLNGVADRTEIEGFIQLPSPPAGAGFPPNRIFLYCGKNSLFIFGKISPQGVRIGDLERKFFPQGMEQILCFSFGKHKLRLGQ